MAREVIVVRSLTESDLGIFDAHRHNTKSKQRAININSNIARSLISDKLYEAGEANLTCTFRFRDAINHATRPLAKIHKNWRLGGRKIEGSLFSKISSKDFMLLRSIAKNDGSHPADICFVSRQTDPTVHAHISTILERRLVDSMALFEEGTNTFASLAVYCPKTDGQKHSRDGTRPLGPPRSVPIPRMPRDKPAGTSEAPKSIKEKLRTPHLLEQMLRVSADLSAPAQLAFLQTVEQLASQLRQILLATGRIIRIPKDHKALWASVAGRAVGFVDGGLANLTMLGSAPIAARVGGYMVIPGRHDSERESFTVLKYLIDELYTRGSGGVYGNSFPDIGALRDAARISIESAGAVRLLENRPDLSYLFLHGALVNPVSRYTDIMKDGRVLHAFPNFSSSALKELLPSSEPPRSGRDCNFISVHLRQLQILYQTEAIVCGVIEREASTTSVCRAVLDTLDESEIAPLLPQPPDLWKQWFRSAIDPSEDDQFEGQRINDSLLFRCLLEPGEALVPVPINRNVLRKAPEAWREVIAQYPVPRVSYLQVTEWTAPIRLELFDKDIDRFSMLATLVMHCALLLPRYAFPVGLDIVDKFARIPDWMSKPVNTRTVTQALKRALDDGNAELFDHLRRMLCGSSREFLLRPGIFR